MEYSQLVKYFISLLVVCNPFSAIPALLSFTRGRSLDEKKKTGLVCGFAVFLILIISTWLGKPILQLFDIRVAAFQLAGGFVVFLLSLSMLHAEKNRMKETSEDQKEAMHKDSVAVVPLAIPIIAGPGAISTSIVVSTAFPGWVNQMYMSLCAILVALTLTTFLYFASRLEKILGQAGMNILGRIGGLILAAIAVETMSKGVIGLFPALGQ